MSSDLSAFKDGLITVPISVGELYDKYSILQIKQNMITDVAKLKSVNKELNYLSGFVNKLTLDPILQKKMREVNEKLWKIEDDIRIKESRGEFDAEFIELARSVYKTNDERCVIKNKINSYFNSELNEVKSYVSMDKPKKTDIVEELSNLGKKCEIGGKFREAIQYYEELIKKTTDVSVYGVHVNQLGVCHNNIGEFEKAIEYFKMILKIKNDIPEIYNNIGNSYVSLKKYKDAEINFLISLKIIESDCTNISLANLYFYMKDYEKSLVFYNKVPYENLGQFIYNLSFSHLGKKDFIKGFELYENRLIHDKICRQTGKPTRVSIPQIPNWNGKAQCNHLLIIYEQGIGDNIQYYRFLIQFARENPQMKITYFAKNTVADILEKPCENIDIVKQLSETGRYNYKIYIMSLPNILKINEISPITESYINIDEKNNLQWKNVLSSISGFKVGFAYNGLLSSFIEKNVDIEEFAKLSSDVNFICLHKMSEVESDVKKMEKKSNFHFFDIDIDEEKSFQDTIAILNNIDLLITVDTAIVHLAGVMGVKTWLLLGYGSDWRWFNDDYCSWYNSVELIRMRKNVELKNVMPVVKKKLLEIL